MFVCQEAGAENPASVTGWLGKCSKRHGRAQASTTADIYAHVMEEAGQKSADILGGLFLKKA